MKHYILGSIQLKNIASTGILRNQYDFINLPAKTFYPWTWLVNWTYIGLSEGFVLNVMCRLSLSVYPGDNLWDYFLREPCWPEKFRTFEIIFYKLVLAFMRACHECSFWRKRYTHKSLQLRFSCIFEKEIYLKIYIHWFKHSIDLF